MRDSRPRRGAGGSARKPEPVGDRLTVRLCRPVDAASLAVFRIAFGAILFWEVVRYFYKGWIEEAYIAPRFHFTYPGFGWVAPWPDVGMDLHFIVLGMLAALVMAGLRYRAAAVLLFLGWTYVFLLEQAAYLNHLYLLLLLAFLMMFIPAQRDFALDARRSVALRSANGRSFAEHKATLPQWALWAVRLQVAIPYVYGGIAKLNADWLQGQPMQIWMARMDGVREVLPWFGDRWAALAASCFACAFDLCVVPLLLWRRTRAWAFAAAVLFHLMNAAMFHIGIFPWLMIAATTLFLSPDWPRRLLRAAREPVGVSPRSTSVADAPGSSRDTVRRGVLVLLGLFFAVQLLVPFRHWLYPGHVDWTETGYRFSWRMMLHEKNAAINMTVRDPRTNRNVPVNLPQYLTPRQLNAMSSDPWMIRQFAQALKRALARGGHGEVEIRALVLCSLNGRKPQLLIDPTVNLAADGLDRSGRSWIVPLVEPLRDEPWNVPQRDWLKHVDVSRVPRQP